VVVVQPQFGVECKTQEKRYHKPLICGTDIRASLLPQREEKIASLEIASSRVHVPFPAGLFEATTFCRSLLSRNAAQ